MIGRTVGRLAAMGAILSAVALPVVAGAAGIDNGDFATGSLAGWSLDTDGSPGQAPDFSVVGAPGAYAARIEADFFATPGTIESTASDRVFLANTLHQALDTTAPPTEPLTLSFDWTFGGQDGAAAGGETFLVGLGNGTGVLHGADGRPGHLVAPTSTYGSGTTSVQLDPAAFNGVPGWTIEFQLGVGVDPATYEPNALGSFVEIRNVALPEPVGSAPLLVGIGALCLVRGARRKRARLCSGPDAGAALRGHGMAFRLMRALLVSSLALGLCSTASAAGWTDVSTAVGIASTRAEFDRVTPGLASYVTVTNTSGGPLAATLRLVVDATLPVTNASGHTGSYLPYFDVPPLADAESVTVRVTFERVRGPLSLSARLEQLEATSTPLAVVTPPSLSMNPNGTTPLAGRITAETNVAARARLTVTGASETFTVDFPEFQTEHALPLLGLKPNASYSVVVDFFDQQGSAVSGGSALQATTGPLPSDFPSMTVFTSQPSLMEPGFTLIDRFNRNDGGSRYATILDAQGSVVWYGAVGGSDMEQSANGNLNLGVGPSADEIDMLGTLVSSVPLNGGQPLHHDLFRTAYGTFLTLGRVDVIEPAYPTSETDPNAPTASAILLDEPAMELGPDGNVLNVWPLADLIDTTRIAYDALTLTTGGKSDWVHANAITHDPRDDSMLVSLRHQDAVLKISRYTGKLIWILGPHDNWKPAFQPYLLTPVGSPFEWQFHQHAIEVTPSGTFMLFDNGNRRASPFDGKTPIPDDQNYSRAVEYAVDESTMEVTQVWEWGGNVADPLFAWFISDADAQPQTGNVLIDFGGNSHYANHTTASLGWGTIAVRVVEVTHETPAQKVFDVLMYLPLETSNLFAYRAERIPSLYPPNVSVTYGP